MMGNRKFNQGQCMDGQSKENFGSQRKIEKHPFRVLDAPNLIDDFYLNLLDWS